MGVRKNEGITPSWVMTLGSMADTIAERPEFYIQVRCRKCRQFKTLDIPTLTAKLGRDYRLLDKRTRCRLTPGCDGWNVFGWSTGTWVNPLSTWAQEERWMSIDMKHEKLDDVCRAVIARLRACGLSVTADELSRVSIDGAFDLRDLVRLIGNQAAR